MEGIFLIMRDLFLLTISEVQNYMTYKPTLASSGLIVLLAIRVKTGNHSMAI